MFVRPSVQKQLLKMNQEFYRTVAAEFDRTRQGLPVGMLALAQRLHEQLPQPIRLLDAGCGNGRFARALVAREIKGSYTGLDADRQLLDLAAAQTKALPDLRCQFVQADLTDPGWDSRLDPGGYDVVVALAVLHHLPGEALRQQVTAQLAGLLAPRGLLALSTWQFLSSERLAARTVDWSTVGLNGQDVEPGDAVLPWEQGTHALRYVHHLDLAEVERLLAACQLHLSTTFRADGKEGNLNLFVVAQRCQRLGHHKQDPLRVWQTPGSPPTAAPGHARGRGAPTCAARVSPLCRQQRNNGPSCPAPDILSVN